jgi:hypothetical protein
MEASASPALFRGGVNLDLGRRYYGIRRLRATYPIGRIKIDDDHVSMWVTRFAALPPSLPLPLVLTKESVCVFATHVWPIRVGVGFRTSSTVHYFWTYRPGRIMRVLREAGYTACEPRHRIARRPDQ